MIIRKYTDSDNLQWVRCRVLSLLDTAYFDSVLREKEHYQNPSIELVAEIDGKIIGLIDVEYEIERGTVCYYNKQLGGVIRNLAVLPEYRKLGIATVLLNEAIRSLKVNEIERVEVWTRDDKWVNDWYKNRGFSFKKFYLHVYTESDECDEIVKVKVEKLHVCNCFAHYVGENTEEIKSKFKRIHKCNLYELYL